EVAVVRHEKYRGGIFVRVALTLDGEIAAVANNVSVREDALAVDHEAGADATTDRAGIPRRAIIRLHFGRGDANEAVLNLAVRLSVNVGRQKKREAAQE